MQESSPPVSPLPETLAQLVSGLQRLHASLAALPPPPPPSSLSAAGQGGSANGGVGEGGPAWEAGRQAFLGWVADKAIGREGANGKGLGVVGVERGIEAIGKGVEDRD